MLSSIIASRFWVVLQKARKVYVAAAAAFSRAFRLFRVFSEAAFVLFLLLAIAQPALKLTD